MKKVSDKYYIQVHGKHGKPVFEEIKGIPLVDASYKQVDLFYHHTDNNLWNISEGKTGAYVICYRESKPKALKMLQTRYTAQQIEDGIAGFLDIFGLSPRYSKEA